MTDTVIKNLNTTRGVVEQQQLHGHFHGDFFNGLGSDILERRFVLRLAVLAYITRQVEHEIALKMLFHRIFELWNVYLLEHGKH